MSDALDPHAGTTQKRLLPERLHTVRARTRVRRIARPLTPSGANPGTLAIEPPTGDLLVTGPVRVLQFRPETVALLHEPHVARAEIDVRDRVVGPSCDFRRLMSDGTPEVGHEPVDVADHFQ